MTAAYHFVRSQHARILFGLLMFMLILLIPTSQRTAYAATLVVTNGTSTIANGDGCSLPEAIINTNNSDQSGSTDCIAGIAGANEIILQTNVNLTVVLDATNGANGLPPIQSPLTIFGNNFTVGRDVAAPSFRIFYVDAGAVLISSLTMYDVTVSNGDASAGGAGDFGGGLYNFGRPVSINRSLFIGNNATASGGAIFNTFNGTTDIIQTTIGTVANPNTAVVNGGGVASITGVTRILDGSLVEFNNAPDGSGVASLGGTVDVVNSTIQNHQGTDGGGIWTAGASTTNITGSTIQQNNVTGNGGGIFMQGGTVNLNNSLVDNNSTQGFGGGGGIHCTGTLNVNGSTISNNLAGGAFANDGGGIFGAAGCGLTIDNSTISGNRVNAGGDGAGVFIDTDITVTNSTFADNRPNGAAFNASEGGALHISPAGAQVSTIDNVRFENNAAGSGGALYLDSFAIPITNISNSTFSGNQALSTLSFDGGGAIWNEATALTITGTLFSNNSTAANGDGGAINHRSFVGTILEVYNSTFSGNSASRGSIVWNNQDPNAIFTNVTGANNPTTHATNNGAFGGGGFTTVTNSALANAAVGGNCMPFGAPPPITLVVDGGNNISDDATCAFANTGGIGVGDNVNPLLAGLADNGGPTLTHALLVGSPALDAANGPTCAAAPVNNVDQRGVGRGIDSVGGVGAPEAGDCDIGAFEFGAVLPTISFDIPASAVDELAGPVPLVIGYSLTNPAGGNLAGQTIDVALQISGTASDGTDFTITTTLPQTLVIPAAGTALADTLDVNVIDDTLVEGAENVILTLVPVGPFLPGANMSHTVTITSDDVPVVSPVGPGAGGGPVAGGVIFVGGGGGTTIIQGGFDDADFLTKTVDRTLAAIGDTVTFTINANNPKDIPLTEVVIKDVLDSGYTDPTIVSASLGSPSVDDNTVTVSDFTLQPGETMELILTAQVSGRVLTGQTLGNIASLESPDASVHFSNAVEVFVPPTTSSLFLETADESVPIITPGNVLVIGGSLPRTGERQRPLWPFVAGPIAVAVVLGGVVARRRLAA